MSSIDHLQSLTLDLPPSCIEFWPYDEQYAVVGTYNLESQQQTQATANLTSQRRSGSLILLQAFEDNVNIIQTVTTPSAVLDIHFGPTNHPCMFGVATSTGSV